MLLLSHELRLYLQGNGLLLLLLFGYQGCFSSFLLHQRHLVVNPQGVDGLLLDDIVVRHFLCLKDLLHLANIEALFLHVFHPGLVSIFSFDDPLSHGHLLAVVLPRLLLLELKESLEVALQDLLVLEGLVVHLLFLLWLHPAYD